MDTVVGGTSLTQMKQIAKKNIQSIHAFSKNVRAIGVVAIRDKSTRDFVIAGLSAIGMAAVVIQKETENSVENVVYAESVNQNDLVGFDFFLFDGEHEWIDVVKYMKAGLVPVMPEKNVFSGMLKDFNPMKFEGNGFFYKSDNPYCIFEKIVAYSENVKFPEDRRVLLKNIIGTF